MTQRFLIGLILFAVLALPLGCSVLSWLLCALGGLGEYGSKQDEEMRRWLEANAEKRDWAIGDSDEQRH